MRTSECPASPSGEGAGGVGEGAAGVANGEVQVADGVTGSVPGGVAESGVTVANGVVGTVCVSVNVSVSVAVGGNDVTVGRENGAGQPAIELGSNRELTTPHPYAERAQQEQIRLAIKMNAACNPSQDTAHPFLPMGNSISCSPRRRQRLTGAFLGAL